MLFIDLLIGPCGKRCDGERADVLLSQWIRNLPRQPLSLSFYRGRSKCMLQQRRCMLGRRSLSLTKGRRISLQRYVVPVRIKAGKARNVRSTVPMVNLSLSVLINLFNRRFHCGSILTLI